jgi:hypothetical protein
MFAEISFMAVVIGAVRKTLADEAGVAIVAEIGAKLKALGARVLLEIYGMPILNADRAKNVLEQTRILSGDSQAAADRLIQAVGAAG